MRATPAHKVQIRLLRTFATRATSEACPCWNRCCSGSNGTMPRDCGAVAPRSPACERAPFAAGPGQLPAGLALVQPGGCALLIRLASCTRDGHFDVYPSARHCSSGRTRSSGRPRSPPCPAARPRGFCPGYDIKAVLIKALVCGHNQRVTNMNLLREGGERQSPKSGRKSTPCGSVNFTYTSTESPCRLPADSLRGDCAQRSWVQICWPLAPSREPFRSRLARPLRSPQASNHLFHRHNYTQCARSSTCRAASAATRSALSSGK